MLSYYLLWFEHLAVAWLLVATLVAVLGRFRGRRSMAVLTLAVVFLLAIPYFVASVCLLGMDHVFRTDSGLFEAVTALGVLAIVGSLAIVILGFRPGREDDIPTRAASWPLVWLVPALVAAVALHGLTLWQLERGIRQRLAEVNAQAPPLLLAVAPPEVPETENAAGIYLHLKETLGKEKEFADAPPIWVEAFFAIGGETPTGEPREEPFDFGQAELGDYLAQHQDSIALLLQAAERPHCRFERGWDEPSYSMALPDVNFQLRLVRLLEVDACHKAALGDREAALANVNAIFALSNHAAEDPFLLSTLISLTLQGMAIETLEVVLAAGPIEPEALALPAFDPLIENRDRLQRAMQGEESLGMAMFTDATMIGNFPDDPREFGPVLERLYTIFLIEDDLAEFRERTQRAASIFELPYPEAHTASEQMQLSPPRGLLSRLVLVEPYAYLDHCQRGDAQHRVILAALAIARYQAQHGEMPVALEALTPKFLPAWPTDPYDDQPLRVARGEEKWTIYSLGPDGVDDGGAEMDWKSETGDLGLSVGVWASGVAEVESP